jgi:micrococcal nuclease
VSRHWKPDRRDEWTAIDGYVPARRSWPAGATAGVVLVAAACLGVAVGVYQARGTDPVGPEAKIEWNAVQAVPTRAPDAEDAAWERRAEELDGTSPPAVRASFGYCATGGGSNCVVDGDTFRIGGEKVRIAGIDAPETHPSRCAEEARLGNAATERLHALLNSGAVTMTSIDRDRDVYGRLLRNVAVNGADVGEAMVEAGVAREYGGGRRPWCS